MRIPETVIEEIQEKVDFLEIVGEYTTLSRKGDRFWGCCPFHNEKTPSFSVIPERNVYYCFGCHKGGGFFQFIMEAENLTFVESVRFIAEKKGIAIPESNFDESAGIQKNALKELYNRVSGSMHYILMNSPKAAVARQYLANRGIHEDTIEKFQLGYAPDDSFWLYGFLKSRNYSEDFLLESGLFTKKNPRRCLFSDRLMFPVYSNQGDVVAFSGRTMKSGKNVPKYINSPETRLYRKSELLYGLWQGRESLRKTREFYLCEGNVDVLALYQSGFTSAMAPLGTAFTEEQAKLLKRYANKGYVIFDSDDAGMKATFKAAIISEKQGLQLQVIKLPEKSDPADIIEKEGAETLKNLVNSPVQVFQFLLDYTMVSYDTGTPEGKEQIVRELFPYIESIDSEIKRDACLGMLSETLGVNNKALVVDMNRHTNQQSRKKEEKKPEINQNQKMTDEFFLMLAVSINRDFFPYLKENISKFDFHDERAVVLYKALEESVKNDESKTEQLLLRIGDDFVKKVLVEKISTGEMDTDADQVIIHTLKLVKSRQLEARRLEISRLLNRAEKENISWDMINELINEKKSLDQEIVELKVRD